MALLSAEDVVVRFGGLRALSDANVEVEPGSVTGLIGPNGAGKTTLFNVITGLQEPTSGRVVLDGNDITGKSPFRRARLGIARTFQKLEAFSSLSARDNVLVAAEQRRAWDKSKFDPGTVADEMLERVGIADVAELHGRHAPHGHRPPRRAGPGAGHRTRRCSCSTSRPRVSTRRRPRTWRALLRALVADGLGVLLVEHDMSFVMGTCEYIHVLDFGQIIATGTPTEVQADPAVQAAYLGAVVTEGAA